MISGCQIQRGDIAFDKVKKGGPYTVKIYFHSRMPDIGVIGGRNGGEGDLSCKSGDESVSAFYEQENKMDGMIATGNITKIRDYGGESYYVADMYTEYYTKGEKIRDGTGATASDFLSKSQISRLLSGTDHLSCMVKFITGIGQIVYSSVIHVNTQEYIDSYTDPAQTGKNENKKNI